MNRDEMIRAFTLRIDGATYAEIAKEIGLATPEKVWKELRSALRMRGTNITGVHQGLVQWMNDNECSRSKLAKMTGLSDGTIRALLAGDRYPHGYTVEKILEATGLTYEEAFTRKVD